MSCRQQNGQRSHPTFSMDPFEDCAVQVKKPRLAMKGIRADDVAAAIKRQLSEMSVAGSCSQALTGYTSVRLFFPS